MNALCSARGQRFVPFLAVAVSLAWLAPVHAQPTVVSIVPANNATGIATNTTVVFTFSEPMNPAATAATFLTPPNNIIPTLPSWSAGNTKLTCTPLPSFPVATIIWSLNGANPGGQALVGSPAGLFTTSAIASGGGSGTNAITTFSVGKIHHYNQVSAGTPTLDLNTPYDFSAVTALASNRMATNVVLTFPTASVSNMFQLPAPQAEKFVLYGANSILSAYDLTYPAGNYSFQVKSVTSNQTVVVNLPSAASLPQPGVPHLTNQPAAQVVNPDQEFVLGWEVLGGGTAGDYIDVEIGDVYSSPAPGSPGALTGAARTFTIPAGVLEADTAYLCELGFFRHVGATNATYATTAYRATYTEFALTTTARGQLILVNPAFAPADFSFDVLTTNGQPVTVEYRTNLTTGQWQTLFMTNSPGSSFRAVAPQATSNQALFFRAKNGN